MGIPYFMAELYHTTHHSPNIKIKCIDGDTKTYSELFLLLDADGVRGPYCFGTIETVTSG